MKRLEDIVSADCNFRVAFFEREDGTYGYDEFKNTNDATNPSWHPHSSCGSRFASQQIAIYEAEGRLAWLKKERAWPARERMPVATTAYMPDWMRCPFCGTRFSLCDKDRWGGGRHLTCGQRIIHMAEG